METKNAIFLEDDEAKAKLTREILKIYAVIIAGILLVFLIYAIVYLFWA